ncbi:MAG: tetratricopeptide repeat protein [Planctomycetota bacterium]|nr:tetratricopeptide repeat protein [Planctomycetota bacterium]MDG2144297.1 tetratricopeptide repeat protein [Planctomycetota bacterium]
MKTAVYAILLLLAAAALGIGAAIYVRPTIGLEPVEGTAFDSAFTSSDRSTEIAEHLEDKVQESQAAPEATTGYRYWVQQNNKGLEALKEGEYATACAILERCVEAHPEQKLFTKNLVEALSRLARGLWEQGDRQEAVWKLERAVELCQTLGFPDQRPNLVKLLERWHRIFGVESDFWQDTSQHFQLSYDANHADLANGFQDVINLLEAAYADLRDFFGADPVFDNRGKHLRVVLYRRDNFDTVTGLHSWAGGAFDGTIRVPIGNLDHEIGGLDPLLRHELVHAFIESIGGKSVPGWFNEGLAQWLSGERSDALVRAKSIFQGTNAKPFLPMSELGGSFSTWTDEDKVRRAYTQSVVLVDALANRYGERFLASLTSAAQTGEIGIESAFEAQMGRTLADFLGEVVADYTSQ